MKREVQISKQMLIDLNQTCDTKDNELNGRSKSSFVHAIHMSPVNCGSLPHST